MKKTYVLASLFFVGLALLWGLEYAKFPRERERLARSSRVLQDLFDVQIREIREIEFDRAGKITRFERKDGGRWEMVKPIQATADSAKVDNLIQNLIDLPRSPDAGTINEAGQGYGLEPPSAVIRLAGKRRSEASTNSGISASLEVGKRQGDVRFVRSAGGSGIEAVDEKLLGAIDQPIAAWREKALLPLPTFQVVGLAVEVDGAVAYQASRSRSGRWVLQKPIAIPADGLKIDNLLAQLSSLKVEEGSGGFVADDVQDFGKFGLDKPGLAVTIETNAPGNKPIVLQFGKPVPDHPDGIYVRRGDQNNVVAVNSKVLAGIPRNAKDLRVSHVSQVEPGRVVKIEIDAPSLGKLILNRTPRGWEQAEPKIERVDVPSVQKLIDHLSGLQSSELLDSSVDPDSDPRMSPSMMTVKVWEQARPTSTSGGATEPRQTLSIKLGQHDVLRKTVYGRLEGDSVIVAIPDIVLNSLPDNAFAYRDRAVLTLNPGIIKKLRVSHDGQTREIVPATSGGSINRWKMTEPIEARVDMTSLSQIFATLSQLRALEFVAEDQDRARDREFGLDQPTTEITWETEAPANPSKPNDPQAPGRLRVGKSIGKGGPASTSPSAYYAKLDQLPLVFTLDASVVEALHGELHEREVLSFDPNRASKVVIRWPERTATFARKLGSGSTAMTWIADPNNPAPRIDPGQLSSMLTQIAKLQTIRFFQYRGIFPVLTGLQTPRLTIEIHQGGDPNPRILRIGKAREDGLVYAAAGAGDSGPVFFLPAPAWNQLSELSKQANALPDDPFAPAAKATENKP